MNHNQCSVEKNYTKVANRIILDQNISLKAKGLYDLLMYYFCIPGFTIYKSVVMSKCTEGKAAFNACWDELKAAGYLKQYRKQKDGRFAYEYELLTEPRLTDDEEVKIAGDDLPETSTVKEHPTKTAGLQTMLSKEKKEDQSPMLPNPEVTDDGPVYPEEAFTQNIGREIESTLRHRINRPLCRYGGCLSQNFVSLESIRRQVDYEDLSLSVDTKLLDEVIFLIQDVYAMPEEGLFKVAKQLLPAKMVQERFRLLDRDRLEQVLLNFTQKSYPVTNMRAYMLTALYNEASFNRLGMNNLIRNMEAD